MRINNNLMSMNAHRQLTINTGLQGKSLEKLSSGYRINRAGDDAAGLSISEKMRGQIRGLTQASRNAQDGISLIQTVEGNLNEVHSILQRMRELSVQAANDTNETEDRTAIAQEISSLTVEMDRISKATEFNKKKLLDGSISDLRLQIGANADPDANGLIITFSQLDSTSLGLGAVDVSSYANATAAITSIDNAIEQVSMVRSGLGAIQNRLEHTINNLDNAAENLQAAESRIRDADMAKEMMAFTKNNILIQASTAMLAQGNQAPQSVLQLLR
ncbi:flagellin [Geosporobacter ferrireducens]|uniref:Flagellin n=1 Tax=Geosporobacter ferrireducens TaxID=1424294 RepID=A0A1D8GM01_9FIRM|nr:flagellin [Geosporobacter ferrireducens]AOT71939.1 flagellin [Geosporobacter ferrireducens]MTI55728.1 flagellin [Geosporobacter ferrireducens]